MKFLSLSLLKFRNISSCSISLDAKHVMFIGENAQGKTNLLESMYMACYGSSFRTRKTSQLIFHGAETAKISVKIEEKNSVHHVDALIRKGSITMRVDGKDITDRKELIELFPCIVFSHEDIEFVKGPPEQKRRFFDQTMCLHDSLFFDDIRRYNRVLRQRNQALKDERYSLLPAYDSQLASLGISIQNERKKLTDEFNQVFPQVFSRVSQMADPPVMVYRPSWKLIQEKSAAEQYLREHLQRDIRFQTTTSGPHRDRFVCMREGKDFAETASTGQLRLVSLVLKAAQAQYYTKKTGRLPVLLLDDVLLELDHTKRSAFIKELSGYEQAVFTFLPQEEYGESEIFQEAKEYQVREGEAGQ